MFQYFSLLGLSDGELGGDVLFSDDAPSDPEAIASAGELLGDEGASADTSNKPFASTRTHSEIG